jgi:hypothetical protein
VLAVLSTRRSSNTSTFKIARGFRGDAPRAGTACFTGREPKNRVMDPSFVWARGCRRRPAERDGQGPPEQSAFRGSQGRRGAAGTTGASGQRRQFG